MQNKYKMVMNINKTKFFAGTLIGIIVVSIGILCFMIFGPLLGGAFQPKQLPSAILQIQSMEQTGEIGLYWWDGGGPDIYAIHTPRDALVVNSPFSATLKLIKDTPPSDVRLYIIIAEKMKKVSYEKKVSFDVWDTGGSSIKNSTLLEKNLLPQKEQTINLELESGLYIMLVHASWEQNEVEYGFLVDIK